MGAAAHTKVATFGGGLAIGVVVAIIGVIITPPLTALGSR